MMLNIVRTTLNLDDDVLEAARTMSKRRGQPIGAMISDLARRSLTSPHSDHGGSAALVLLNA
ncbi:MAG: hypothetical protein ACR2MQ_16905 [Gemmatimonadaceae bacterium]